MINTENLDYNTERMEKLQEICKPIEDYINEYGNPHSTIIITQNGMAFTSDEFFIKFDIRD